MVLVDTPVWSVALQRRALLPQEEPLPAALRRLIVDGRAQIVGAIRQELLSGVREPGQFSTLRDYLRQFEDVTLTAADYEAAADASNTLHSAGIACSPVDALICAVSVSREWEILSTDADFARYASILPLRLHPIPAPP